MTKDSEHAREQAQAQMEMVARLRAATDDEAYEDLAPTLAKEAGFEVIGGGDSWCYRSVKKGADEDVSVYTTEEEAWVACCNDNGLRPDEDDVRRAIEEDALSVQVRSGWHSPGEKLEAAEYEVLLCTGGPAVRIVGALNRYNESLWEIVRTGSCCAASMNAAGVLTSIRRPERTLAQSARRSTNGPPNRLLSTTRCGMASSAQSTDCPCHFLGRLTIR